MDETLGQLTLGEYSTNDLMIYNLLLASNFEEQPCPFFLFQSVGTWAGVSPAAAA